MMVPLFSEELQFETPLAMDEDDEELTFELVGAEGYEEYFSLEGQVITVLKSF